MSNPHCIEIDGISYIRPRGVLIVVLAMYCFGITCGLLTHLF